MRHIEEYESPPNHKPTESPKKSDEWIEYLKVNITPINELPLDFIKKILDYQWDPKNILSEDLINNIPEHALNTLKKESLELIKKQAQKFSGKNVIYRGLKMKYHAPGLVVNPKTTFESWSVDEDTAEGFTDPQNGIIIFDNPKNQDILFHMDIFFASIPKHITDELPDQYKELVKQYWSEAEVIVKATKFTLSDDNYYEVDPNEPKNNKQDTDEEHKDI